MKKICALLLCLSLSQACFSNDFKIYRKSMKREFWGHCASGAFTTSLMNGLFAYCTYKMLQKGKKSALVWLVSSWSFCLFIASIPFLQAKRIKQWNDLKDPILVLTKDGFTYQEFDHTDFLFCKKPVMISCAWQDIKKFWIVDRTITGQYGITIAKDYLWSFYIAGRDNILEINQSDVDLSQKDKDALTQLFHSWMLENQKS